MAARTGLNDRGRHGEKHGFHYTPSTRVAGPRFERAPDRALAALESTSAVGGAVRRALGYAHLADGTTDARLGQAWLGALVRTEGRFGDLVSGIPLDSRYAGSATAADVRGPTPTNPNVPGYFWADGFED